MEKFITQNPLETQDLARKMAQKLSGGQVLCLEGDLGGGKTTFTQGLLNELGFEGPFTSPTFAILKNYRKTDNRKTDNSQLKTNNNYSSIVEAIHIDAYRISSQDLLDLGWPDFLQKKNCVIIVEWPEKILELLPENSIWLNFRHLDGNRREIILK